MKTNTGLVSYAKAQLGNPYWYGTFGDKATHDLLNRKTAQYPSHYTNARMSKYESQIGQRVHDCVGLIKGYLWSDSATSKPKYKRSQDVSANGMLKACKTKGKIGTLPEIPGILVFMSGHVGVYIGGGDVIEARGFNYGVVKTKLSERLWTNWGKCPYITYIETVKKYFQKYDGSSKSFQDALYEYGYNGSYSNRLKIAKANGIKLYAGTAKQNTQLFSKYKAGTLIKP